MTTNRFDRTDYCELAEHWVSRYGLASIDPLQRRRLVEHAVACARCGAIVQRFRAVSSDIDATDSIDRSDENAGSGLWPHLAENTLRAWAVQELSADEREAVGGWIEAHLANCEFCADRFAAVAEGPNSLTPERRAVLGRAASTPIVWKGSSSDVAWVIDQPVVGATTWRVSLAIKEASLIAHLRVDGHLLPKNWSFSVPVTTDTVLLPTLMFSDSQRAVTCASPAPVDGTWRATPILTAEVPHWGSLVTTGEEPATMISIADATRRDIRICVPVASGWELTPAGWINDLFVDLRGERVILGGSPDGGSAPLSGRVLDSARREIGAWTLTRSSDAVVELKVSPAPGEIIRIKSDVNEMPEIAEWLLGDATEHSTTHIMSPTFAQQVAFRPSFLRATDQSHLDECAACRDQLIAARQTSHPSVIDLALSASRMLTEMDIESIDRHVATCADRQCLGFHRLSMLRAWMVARATEAYESLQSLVAAPVPLARVGASYNTGSGAARPYSAVVECGQWKLTLEESTDGVLFMGVRSDTPMLDVHEIYVGLYSPEAALERRLPWRPAEFWPAKAYVPNAGTLLSSGGPLRAVVLPINAPSDTESQS